MYHVLRWSVRKKEWHVVEWILQQNPALSLISDPELREKLEAYQRYRNKIQIKN